MLKLLCFGELFDIVRVIQVQSQIQENKYRLNSFWRGLWATMVSVDVVTAVLILCAMIFFSIHHKNSGYLGYDIPLYMIVIALLVFFTRLAKNHYQKTRPQHYLSSETRLFRKGSDWIMAATGLIIIVLLIATVTAGSIYYSDHEQCGYTSCRQQALGTNRLEIYYKTDPNFFIISSLLLTIVIVFLV